MTGSTATLLDGTRTTIRVLGPEDSYAVFSLHAAMDQYDSYLRFFAPPPKKLAPFADGIAQHDNAHLAVGAFVGKRLIGVAHFVRLDDPIVAEIAVVVAHEEQLHGVGTLLLRELRRQALGLGIRQFSADILAQNGRMLRVMDDLHWTCVRQHDDGVVHFEIDLERSGDDDLPN